MVSPFECDVAIVGGGAAGLAAGVELAEAGRRVIVLEARDRLGGRILTKHVVAPDGPELPPIELGAEFIHGEHVVTWEYLRKAGLATEPVPPRHERREHGRRASFPDVFAALAEMLERDLRDGHLDRPVGDLLRERRAAGDDPTVLDAVVRFIQGFHAADLSRIGTAALRASEATEEADGERQFRLAHGYDGLVRALETRLRRAGGEVTLGVEVTRVQWRTGRAIVETRAADGVCTAMETPRVIVTVPLGVLHAPGGAAGALTIAPEPPGWRRALGCLEVGTVARIVLQFDEPWWNDSGSPPVFVHGETEDFPVWWTTLAREAPVITGWSGGPAAARLAGLSCAAVTDRAVASLAAVFGRSVAELASRVRAAYYHDWSSDPWARGGYSYGGVGAQAACALLRRPVEHTLYLAGEALVEGRFGTVHAALGDGRRAARAILESD
ncbi:MAG TPA: NAD(P)/FAD-dependent oxidoreductase [Gemmatimonadales bacterium]|nr:NAD(P)/FAD-dependent oxidoreductase [Gemmatimonadales bacterium]